MNKQCTRHRHVNDQRANVVVCPGASVVYPKDTHEGSNARISRTNTSKNLFKKRMMKKITPKRGREANVQKTTNKCNCPK